MKKSEKQKGLPVATGQKDPEVVRCPRCGSKDYEELKHCGICDYCVNCD